MRIILIVVAVLVVIGLGVALLNANQTTVPAPEPTPPVEETEPIEPTLPVQSDLGSSPENASYTIEGQVVTLTNGRAETPAAPGSATTVITTIFGQPTMGELNGDGTDDAAVMLVQDTGGSGTFYYEAAALAVGQGYQGTNALLLGDRIAPQTTQITDETIVVNFAERAEGEPMTTQPSVGVSKYFKVMGITLTEVANPNQPQGQM